MEYPNAKNHQIISLVKSGIRIAGCVCAMVTGGIVGLAAALLLAEILGILEELV